MTKFYTSAIQYGNNILARGYDNGREIKLKVPFAPTLYLKATKDSTSSTKTVYGELVDPVEFADINEAKDFVKRYQDVENFDVYGMTQYNYQYLAETYPGVIENDMTQMRIWFIDIETTSDHGQPDPENVPETIQLISIKDKNAKTNIVFGLHPYQATPDDTFVYQLCTDEKTLLRNFVSHWSTKYPDIVSGWYIDGFDIPYLINRIRKILGDEYVRKLSPWGLVNSREVVVMQKEKVVWELVGINLIDYIDLYKKFTYSSKESWTLDFIAGEELGEAKKVIPGGTFKEKYTNHWDLFVRYNAHDAELVDRLDDKLKFLDVICTIAFLAKCQFRDVFGPVKTWDVFIYNYLKSKGIVIPPQSKHSGGEFAGGWVKEPVPGMYGWLASFDFESLYPKIITQWNMSPETIVDVYPDVTVDKFIDHEFEPYDEDYSMAANGARFRKDRLGIIPEVVNVTLTGRKITKREMQTLEKLRTTETDPEQKKILDASIAGKNAKQMAFKILANALYGAISNVGFRYFDLRIAEAITLSGQASDRHIERALNAFMNVTLKTDKDYVIAGDTDSVYLDLDPLVKMVYKTPPSIDQAVAFLDKVCATKIQDRINESIGAIYAIGKCFDRVMYMKREVIASRGIWTAKKRYAVLVHNSEGITYTPYKLKIMGMDLVKSGTPQLVRKGLKAVLVTIFEKDQEALYDHVVQVKNEFMNAPIEDISMPRSVNGMLTYADKNKIYGAKCPIAVRGALILNHMTRADTDAIKIRDGDKVKYVYLREPNPTRGNIISFLSHDVLPPNLGLHKYVDKDLQWEKSFIAPLKGITDAIGWRPERTASLESFFE